MTEGRRDSGPFSGLAASLMGLHGGRTMRLFSSGLLNSVTDIGLDSPRRTGDILRRDVHPDFIDWFRGATTCGRGGGVRSARAEERASGDQH